MKRITLVFENNVFDEKLKLAKSMSIVRSGKTTFENIKNEDLLKFVSILKNNDFEIEKSTSEE